jgi:hypothetical protein
MAVINRVLAVPLLGGAVTASYAALNPLGLPNACFLLRIINNSTDPITISYDGITDHDSLPGSTYLQLNAQANSQPNNFIANFPSGFTVYVKGTGSSGNAYVAGYYQPTKQF